MYAATRSGTKPRIGDPARTFSRMLGADLPFNPIFENDNRSKRSITLDLSRPQAREIALELCDGADAYVQTVIRPSLVQAIPAARLQDILDYHSSVEDAAQTAKRAGVRTLVLTHPVPPPAEGTEQEWVDEARQHFDGDVVLAHDLYTLDL